MLGSMRPRTVILSSIDCAMGLHGIMVLLHLHRIIAVHRLIVANDMHEIAVAFDLRRIVGAIRVHRLDVAITWHPTVVALDLHGIVVGLGVRSLTITVHLCRKPRTVCETIAPVAGLAATLISMLIALGALSILTLPVAVDVLVVLAIVEISIPLLGLCLEGGFPYR